jgi:hypothetical protein
MSCISQFSARASFAAQLACPFRASVLTISRDLQSLGIDSVVSAAGDCWRETRSAKKDVGYALPAYKPEFGNKP